MNIEIPWMAIVWLGTAVLMGLVEAATFNFVAIWFAVGAVAAIIPASFRLPLPVQLAIFTLVSVLSLIFTRPFVHSFIKTKRTRTNADSLVGRIGVVLVPLTGEDAVGRVTVGGQDWAAVSEDGQPIDEGEKVLIKDIVGVRLVVEKLI